MTDYSGAFVVNTQNPPTPPLTKQPYPRRKFLYLVGIVLFLIGLTTSGFFAYKKLLAPRLITKKVINKGKLSDLAGQGHPTLFWADLEYNPNTATLIQHSTGTLKGDAPNLSKTPISTSNYYFTYRLEVLSDSQEVLQSGYRSVARELIQTPQGTLRFKPVSSYFPKSTVAVYSSDNKLLWSTKIQ